VIQINQTFSGDTVITPFSGSVPVYSLSFSGGVNLLSDSSLVRVVLIDTDGNQYMIFESYPLITLSNTFDTLGAADETAFLNGVVCDSLHIDIINAFLEADSLKLDTAYIPNVPQLQAQAKWNHDSVKIDIMNQRIEEENMYWRAGRTYVSDLFFDQRESLTGGTKNLEGFEYYRGGIFERLSAKILLPSTYESAVVADFDWRYRHDATNQESAYWDGKIDNTGWITEIKNQLNCQYCWAFSPIAALEARANIYYNSHDVINHNSHLDLKLSELHVTQCHSHGPLYPPGHHICLDINTGPGWQDYDALNYMKNTFIDNDECYCYLSHAYQNTACESSAHCYDPEYQAKIEGYSQAGFAGDIDNLKKQLILNGPLASGSYSLNHFWLLVGFETLDKGDIVYKGTSSADPDIVIEKGSRLEGNVTWRFKNSWGDWGSNGFSNTNIDISDIWAPQTFKLTGEVQRKIDGELEPIPVQCTDEDNDGYYWWGLGLKPSTCPAASENERDCDDWDKNSGPYNENPNNPDYLLYECTDNCIKYNDILVIPPGYPPITDDFHLRKDVEVPGGSTLTINGNVWISPEVEIRVYSGGQLNLGPNARLTSACTDLWNGIVLYGTSGSQTPSAQGKVVMVGNSVEKPVIEQAICAIQTAGTGESGGIIQATDAIFRNNRTSVQLMAYSNAITVTSFIRCTFETDPTLPDGSLPVQHVSLSGLASSTCLVFEGCTFFEHGEERTTTGIRAHNSFFSCITDESGSSPQRNVFTKLLYGVYATNDEVPGCSFILDDCYFNGNFRGVFASAIQGARIVLNDFTVPLLSSSYVPQYGFTAYGLYLETCNGYLVEGNSFNGNSYADQVPPPGYVATCGTFVNHSGPYENEIYRNSYNEFHCAVAVYRENRNGSTGVGLRIKCNEFTNNGIDIGVFKGTLPLTTDMGIKYEQGVYNTSSSSLSAGNIFTSSSFQYHTWDIANYSNDIQYNYHRESSTMLKVKPDDNLIVNTDPYENELSVYNSSSCPEVLDDGSSEDETWLKEELASTGDSIETISAEMAVLTDGGLTYSLNQSIFFGLPSQSWELYADLIEESPYLSDTVMKSAVAKESVFPNAMIRDILVANPHGSKNDSIMELIDNRFIPMPDSLLAQILDGQAITGMMDSLRIKRASFNTTYSQAFNRLLNLYLHDTIIPGVQDSITALFERDFRLHSKYKLALRLLNDEKYNRGDSLMAAIPGMFTLSPVQTQEYQHYSQFYTCVKRARLNLASLTFDSIQVENLNYLILSDSGFRFFPTIMAKNALQASGHLSYVEPLVFDTELKSAINDDKRPFLVNPEGRFLRIFPNPAQNYVVISYRVNPTAKTFWITITRMDGTVAHHMELIHREDQITWPTGDLLNGSYLVSLFGDGKVIQTQKLIISR